MLARDLVGRSLVAREIQHVHVVAGRLLSVVVYVCGPGSSSALQSATTVTPHHAFMVDLLHAVLDVCGYRISKIRSGAGGVVVVLKSDLRNFNNFVVFRFRQPHIIIVQPKVLTRTSN